VTGLTTLTVETVAQHVVLVTMNRPDRSNALNTAMASDLIEVFEGLAMQSGTTRCVILTGAGDKAFCAGGDLKERNGMTDAAWRDQHVVFERMARALLNCPVPLIAAVNGAAYGGGCEIAACADFVYAADTVRFALTETTLGIIPGAGGTQTVARAIGERRAKELIFSGEPFDAKTAEHWGLVNKTFPPVDRARRTHRLQCSVGGPSGEAIDPTRAADVAVRRNGVRDRSL